MTKQRFLLTGTGGQGLILAGIILAEAGIKDGRNAAQSQSYGPEARGGACRAEVIIGDEEIYYPKIETPDFVLTLSQEAYKKYGLHLKDDVVLIVDDFYVPEVKPRINNFYSLPITKATRDELRSEQGANIVALGVLGSLSEAVSLESLKQAVRQRVPLGTIDRNLKALDLGWELGQNEKEKLSKPRLTEGDCSCHI
ncbi:2-oxoacid:ferredoxin oxidoreductase, gamma subunit [Desulfosporosinus acidiphilus SJ4]|uniref:2-oxoacid:ferredoxin oxidoreductase, gamma subunit n=1 Tax=Desulfosporosinus acidiphilus (strain DSM 22704 / JCM 16185 / SJ4) TaxID=646529 RepID=I4D630_DESAJ|nr:2-oxoacid:acceptor oxidoreductase family protein [Desulfosporosinus acidiphilus]AFM41254.1 2-oxoacid:ferredoxin oxidoreductase, gamma subunit [Desulfosporosinus acidiphilus SJ4]